MRYCARCVYPENARPAIIFDDAGVCSGCRYHESRDRANWDEREKALREILTEYRERARERREIYDCIIPVSGGKDSHFQVHLLKNVYGMNPLLVAYNHCFNTRLGVRNLRNLVKQFGCDLVRVTSNLHSARKIARYMVRKVGDITWHYHAGIRTVPFQMAVRYKIPLMIWGEHGYAELTGMFRLEDMVEYTKWTRQEHDMRGYEPEDLINEESGLTWQDMAPFVYPRDEEIEELGVRGIYLSNYLYWDARAQGQLVHDKYSFDYFRKERDRTFAVYGKTDDHANDVHDYMKYLKFGYGRTTDDAATEVRHGRMTREEAIALVGRYDHVRPSSLDLYLNFLGMAEQEFEASVDPMRDKAIWQRAANGRWTVTDSIVNHVKDAGVEAARVPLVPEPDRTFGAGNRHMYVFPGWEPAPRVDDSFVAGESDDEFLVL